MIPCKIFFLHSIKIPIKISVEEPSSCYFDFERAVSHWLLIKNRKKAVDLDFDAWEGKDIQTRLHPKKKEELKQPTSTNPNTASQISLIATANVEFMQFVYTCT